MANEAPAGGNPSYDLSDLEDGEVEDSQPMMLGKTVSSETPDVQNGPPVTTEKGIVPSLCTFTCGLAYGSGHGLKTTPLIGRKRDSGGSDDEVPQENHSRERK